MSYYPGPVTVVPATFILRFPPHQTPSPEVPVELKPYYSEDVWGARITAVVRKASKYYKRGLEWVWLIFGLGSLIAVPIAVYYVALNNLPSDKKDDNKDGEHHFFHVDFDNYWKARLISFATWLVLLLVVWVPMRVWKGNGKKAVNQMLLNWENEDRAMRGNAPVPHLRMKLPGIVNGNIKFVVTFPPTSVPSMYQPGAPVPPFIANPPMDPGAQAYYQPAQMQQQQGQLTGNQGQWGPPMSGFVNQAPVQSANMYNQSQGPERVPPYNGPTGHYDEEKAENPFEDVKV